jgi:hypothetical protein
LTLTFFLDVVLPFRLRLALEMDEAMDAREDVNDDKVDEIVVMLELRECIGWPPSQPPTRSGIPTADDARDDMEAPLVPLTILSLRRRLLSSRRSSRRTSSCATRR